METVSFEPIKVEAMIHSLHEKREVFVVFYDSPNRVKAVYDNKLCTAIYNTFTGLFYVDDVYGVLDTLEETSEKERDGP